MLMRKIHSDAENIEDAYSINLEEFNIIGDIAGNYETFLALINKMPKNATVVSVGDMIDRGPKSKDVVEWFFSGNGLAVLGNHEEMLLKAYEEEVLYSGVNLWFHNGGIATIESYLGHKNPDFTKMLNLKFINSNHVEFLSKLPKLLDFYTQHGRIIITHAPIHPEYYLSKIDESVIDTWNRVYPKEIFNAFQVYGHNPYTDIKFHRNNDDTIYAAGIDTSGDYKLTGLHWPSLKTYEQEIID